MLEKRLSKKRMECVIMIFFPLRTFLALSHFALGIVPFFAVSISSFLYPQILRLEEELGYQYLVRHWSWKRKQREKNSKCLGMEASGETIMLQCISSAA